MNENTNTTPDNATAAPDLWCTSCGCHLDVYHEDYIYTSTKGLGSARITNTIGTCRNANCKMYSQTLSPDEWMSQARLDRYQTGAVVQFDVWTGIVIQVVDQQLANQIAWLMMHADAEQIAAFERYTAHHSNDDDYAQMVGAFVEGIQDAPNYDLVCNTVHMEGR